MLFLQDDLRIRSGSYAVLPFVDLENPAPRLESLENLQTVVAYFYAAPHHTSGDTFLSYENASLAILNPARVSIYLVRPDHHVEQQDPKRSFTPDGNGFVQGYDGLYNFKHHFYVARGSRLYPPVPHISLNISQDLSADFDRLLARPRHWLLLQLIKKPANATSDRILTAITWFNAANSRGADEETAIVNLAIAIETLLGLPEGQKTERVADSVALLLGRIPRLDIWVRQFYQTRSDIVHEGRARRLRFIATDSRKVADGPLYHSLLNYGRHVFRLCVGSLLFGADLAEEAGLEEKLVTNQERFEQICEALSDDSISALERLERIAQNVEAADRYRFVGESGLKFETMLASARLAAQALLACDDRLEARLKERLERLTTAKKSPDHYEALEALRELSLGTPNIMELGEPSAPRAVARRLMNVIWGYTFMRYFWLKQHREEEAR